MARREINGFGRISNDGRLSMYMEEVNDFFRQWKGRRVVVKFTVLGEKPSEALKGYYYNYVIPTMKTAFWEAGERMTEEETEQRLRHWSPITIVQHYEEDGAYHTETRGVDDLSSAEMVEHIEWIKELAASEMSVYIEDPQTIMNEKFEN